jgi:hypothetical protein
MFRAVSICAVALFVLFGQYALPARAQSGPEARFAALRPHFVKIWNGDSCAQGESLGEYVDHWVHDYYVVGAGGGGWFEQEANLVGKLPSGADADKIARRLDRLGARIAAEWAKPNDCRKISTFGGANSLSAYGAALDPYLEASGPIDTSAFEATLKSLEASVDQALR